MTTDPRAHATAATIAEAGTALAARLAAPPVPAPGTVVHPALTAGLAAVADVFRAAADRLDAADVPGGGDD